MKRRSVMKLLSCMLVFSLAASSAVPAAAFAAEAPGAEQRMEAMAREILEDGVGDAWEQDEATVKGEGSVVEKTEDGWLHLKAGSGNGNSSGEPSQYPAMFVNPNTFDFAKEGYFEFTLNSVSTKANSRFGIYLGYQNPGNGMFLGYDTGGWFWQKYVGGDGAYYGGERTAAPEADEETNVRVSWTADKKFTLSVNGAEVFKDEACDLDLSSGKIALKLSTYGTNATEILLKNIHYTGQKAVESHQVTGRVVDGEGTAVAGASVTLAGETVVTGEDGSYTFPAVAAGTYEILVEKYGYETGTGSVTVGGEDVAAEVITLTAKAALPTQTLTTDAMDVRVLPYFPAIVQYDMKGDLAGKTFLGQTEEINTIKINGTAIQVGKEDVESSFTENKATYVMGLQAENIDCEITAEITAEKNTASFDITKVVNHLTETDENGYEVYPVQTIEIPNHSLISVNSAQAGANLKAAKMSSNTRISGDKYFDVADGLNLSEDFMYGFVSNNELSAGLWSNSEYEGTAVAPYVRAGGASNTRVMAKTAKVGNVTSLGLGSTAWYYDRMITPRVNGEQRTYVVKHEIMPSAKVVITGEANGDGGIDWQDGAVAFRDIMHNPLGCEVVPELVNYRIAMNFGSQAANPFLTNLDGVKRVYLNTDGLGQGVLLKGYGSEGHDSGHPDYGDIGRRIGGAEDMNTLLTEGKKMGALFGVHVNASEMYTEAKAFDDELSRGNYGWNWLDQGIGINALYDLASGRRKERFQELYDQVGNNLDFIYVDVWGNNTSGAEDSWESRMLSRQINSFGWRMATEWGPTQEYDSTLQHWAADLAYGGYQAKGENSEVMRFLRNHQKDSWIADYPSYSGAAQMPLLGGLNMTDFEGWQGRTDYENYIKVMFRHNLITKYLQHYQIMDWTDGETVNMPTGAWTPEMEITLRNTKDPKDDTEVVVSRDSNDYSNLAQFRSRTIKVNGVTVSTGAPTGGDNSNPGNEKYLIPWNWDPNGKDLDAEDQKLYHWNTKGGESTWTLTKGWEGLENVIVYKLTDEGRTDKQVVEVVDNQITLNAEAEVPYVVYKGEKEDLTVDWQSSKYVYDMGFNDPDVNSHRTITGTGTASIVDNVSANNMLKLDGEVQVATELTNLKPGQKYAVYIGTDNRSDAKAYMKVMDGENVLGCNYATRSFVLNIVSSDQHHWYSGGTTAENNYASYFQNMYVFFTAPKSGKATLTLSREAGEGSTYFDDVRVVETKMNPVVNTDEEGVITELYNDFENNAQGIWPFVISGPGSGTTDNRIHLSERHGKYTQAGYMVKAVDDVLDGNWSVKINGLSQSNSMIYQTIPQNFHFEPGETYYVSFDYQMGGDGTYEVRIGDGTDKKVKVGSMEAAIGETKHYGISFTASESGNSWVGIFSTNRASDMHGLTGSATNFSGYNDFILDNLQIRKTSMMMDQTPIEVTTAEDKVDLDVTFTTEGEKPEVIWESSNESVARVTSKGEVYFVGFGTATISATAVIDGKEVSLQRMVSLPRDYEKTATFQNVWYNTQEDYGEDGRAVNVTDRNQSTIWHSNWATTGFTVSETNPAIITLQFAEDLTEFTNRALRQRSGNNGLVQRYEVIVGDSFDESTETITDPTFSSGPVDAKNSKSGSTEILEIPEDTKGHYLQIKVLRGSNNFASIADILLDTVKTYDTPEERAFMEANAAKVEAEELPVARKALTAEIKEADAILTEGSDRYTEESWNAFTAAYAAAKEGLQDTSKTSSELKQLRAALKAEITNLALTPEESMKELLEKAEEALRQAEQEKAAAEKAKEAAEKAKEEAEKAQAAAGANSEEAKLAQAAAEAAQAKAEAAQAKAEAAQAAAEAAQAKAEGDIEKAEAAQAAAEAAQKAAEAAQAKAEAAQAAAEAAQAEAEAARKAAEAEKAAAAAEREKAEAAKKAAEEAKAQADAARKAAEEARAKAEAAQKAAEEMAAAIRKELEGLQSNKTLGKVGLKSVKSMKKKQLTIKWKAVDGAEGYEVQYAANAKFKKAVTKNVPASKVSLTVKKLKSKKKYFVRIRAFKNVNGQKIYGERSKVKQAKIK